MSPALPPSEPPCRFPTRLINAHKGDFGRALLIGGSRGMAGSIAMSSLAALKTGSGLVTAVVPDRCLESVASFHPAIMTAGLPDDGWGKFAATATDGIGKWLRAANTIGIGPGMTTSAGAYGLVHRVLQHSKGIKVVDADAINLLAQMDWQSDTSLDFASVILTPHPGECARLLGVPASQRQKQIDAATDFSLRTGAAVVLKGGPTVVIDGDHQYFNTTGNPGMATAGSGDVLTGIMTSLAGQGFDRGDAARLGVWLHGRAGDHAADQVGQTSMTAMEILEHLPAAVQAASTVALEAK